MTGFALSMTAVNREVVGLFAVNLILLADGDLLHVGQNVELRQGNLGRALDLAAVAGRNDVDGANSAGTTGGRAVFRASLTKLLGFLTEPFGRERPSPTQVEYAFTIPTVRSTWLPGMPVPTHA